MPIAWTIAGSDSGGGAGIQADLKVMNAFGVHGCSAITALTAQNTQGVTSCEPVTASMLRSQLDTLLTDLPPAAVKTGMLGSGEICRVLVDFFDALPEVKPPLICDPVLKSTSGTRLLETDALQELTGNLFPHVTLLTPNLPEVEVLLGRTVDTIEDAAKRLLETGIQSVLIKGGHSDGNLCRDYWTDGADAIWLSSPRIETSASHGTGCILSSAIAAGIAGGRSMKHAVIDAKTYLNQCLKQPAGIGRGHGPMAFTPFRNAEADRPDVVSA
ncbi:MAG: bifunctional hydroxymethylpyrimidine kinase/phosphomethylpyrimidine kinase [Pontiellaceae bacterium]|nr:bifunctional hydroxymethylpyrimidine kinase/phosphomethylpyrimidine kinase [Pontiellaceae bacterium]MBN2784479.1 bifunctional hydroxymethylpyrimidine kinase/phosphomethylpyrimidine kinase [Pontiellaceae bacterium]